MKTFTLSIQALGPIFVST